MMQGSFVPRSPLLLLAVALVALAVFFGHDSRPAAADHDQSIRELWSATLTVRALDNSQQGCDSADSNAANYCSASATLSDDTFTLSGRTHTIHSISVASGTLYLKPAGSGTNGAYDVLQRYQLYVDGTPFSVSDGSVQGGSSRDVSWSNAGLSWSAGDTVELKLTRPTFIGVELFGGDLDTSNPDRAPELTIAEGGSGTFMVKLTQAPTANVTITLEKNFTPCAGCGNEWHGDVDSATVSPKTLTFTTSNWQTGQTVTVTGVADDDSVHEHVLILAGVSIASGADSDDPYRSPDALNGVWVIVTDGSDDGSQHGGL